MGGNKVVGAHHGDHGPHSVGEIPILPEFGLRI